MRDDCQSRGVSALGKLPGRQSAMPWTAEVRKVRRRHHTGETVGLVVRLRVARPVKPAGIRPGHEGGAR
jgi:hypothetical protein